MSAATRTRTNRPKQSFILLSVVCVFLFAVQAKVSRVDSARISANPLSQTKIWIDPNDHGLDLKIKTIQVSLLPILLVTFFILSAGCVVRPVFTASSHQHLFVSSQHWLRPPPRA